jgi:glycosyltransferase involved in cell wall biosynthesis
MTEVSVVMPCLNEEETVGTCVRKAVEALEKARVDGEVIVVDNGSNDDSVQIARGNGARVVRETKRGYGNAYLRGFKEARGEIIVMADSDDTYDLREIPKFLDAINDGADLVMGSRLKGDIKDGAMPWLHRYVGNPLLTMTLNFLFKAKISDAHCGMRAFRKEALDKMRLTTAGMEFASEMVIKAAKSGLKIQEVPISYYPRGGGKPKLHSFHDGWRHLRFMFLYKHAMLFLTPGTFFFLLGLIFMIASQPTRYHSIILGSLVTILGFQIITLGLYSKVYAAIHGIDEPDWITRLFMKYVSLEYGMLVGSMVFLVGAIIGIRILRIWVEAGFGELAQIRNAIFSSTFAIIGIQIIFATMFLSVLLLEKKEEED